MKASQQYRIYQDAPYAKAFKYYTDIILEIPEEKLGDFIVNIQTGKTPPKSNPAYYSSDYFDWFKPNEIGLHKVLSKSQNKISKKALDDNKATIYEVNTLLINCIGDIGRMSILKHKASSNQQITGLRFNDKVLLEYVYYYLLSHRELFYIDASATTLLIINQKKIKEILIKVPSLEKQREILKVMKLSFEAFELGKIPNVKDFYIDLNFEKNLIKFFKAYYLEKELIELKKTENKDILKLRQSILQEAVQGKLTQDWRANNPDTEDAFNMLAGIKAKAIEENKKRKKKPKWSGLIEETEKAFVLSNSWMWLRLGDICELKQGYAFKGEFFRKESATFVLTTPGNFYENGGFRDREAKRKYYDGPVNEEFVLKAGDLIIPMTEQAAGLLGSPAFIPDDGRVYLHNQRLGKMSFDSNIILPEYSFTFFNSSFFRNELARTCTGMKVRHTSPDRVLCVPFPLPPIKEQKAIVQKVNALMALCDSLAQEVQQSQEHSAQLMQSCLREVFEGERS